MQKELKASTSGVGVWLELGENVTRALRRPGQAEPNERSQTSELHLSSLRVPHEDRKKRKAEI
ncbi:hypothetical protein CONPUDRAFT_86110, partial [Coniophora puteana RWD-64-598 SS2]